MPLIRSQRRRERGVATIFITVVLVLAAGLIALYTSRSSFTEQRLSASEVRAKQALAAAQAGVDRALAHMQNGGINQNDPDQYDGTYEIDTFALETLQSAGGRPAYYHVAYLESTAAIPACPSARAAIAGTASTPAKLVAVTAVSCGWSDDDSSVQRIVQVLSFSPSTGGVISTPLVTKSTTDLLTGGATVMNFFNDLTVWSGGNLLGQSNTGKTFIRDTAAEPSANLEFDYRLDDFAGGSPACNNEPPGYTCSTQGSVLGHDTVGGDTNLSTKTADEFFEHFMGQSRADYINTATWVVDANNSLPNQDSTDVASIKGMGDQVIWVEGNMSLPGDIGTMERPVVLVVNGNLDMTANAKINGIVFVTGNITGTGTVTVYGSMISGAGAAANGNLTLIYDPRVLGATENLGRAGKVPGSWRDW